VQTAPIGGASGLFVYVASATSNDVSAYQLCTVQNANCTQQDVSVFKLLPVGSTSTVGSDPVAMVVDPTKSFLYVISRNSSQVFGFRINATQGTLTALSPANLSTGLEPVAIAMHSTGQFIFVSNNGSANLSSYVLNTTSGEMSSPLTITSLGNPAGLVSK
jgi:6-phosphogluconolactonase (cycloisomerase 2 family)